MDVPEAEQGATSGREFRMDYDSETTSPSIAIVEAIAALEGSDPVGLSADDGVRLYDYVDVEALDTLFSDPHKRAKSLSFPLDAYTVAVTPETVTVERP